MLDVPGWQVLPESSWTKPRDDCPNPQWWHATDGESTEIEVSELLYGFVRALQPSYAVETGSGFGQSTFFIGKALQLNGHGSLDTLEPDENRATITYQRCAGLPVRVLNQSSMEFVPREEIDFAWIDSDFEIRTSEFGWFKDYFRAGSVVGFHDTGRHKGGIWEFIENLSDVRYIQLPTPRGVTFVEIP